MGYRGVRILHIKKVVQRFGLKPIGQLLARTPFGKAVMNTYLIDLILNNEVKFCNLLVMDSEIGNQGIDILIGMDVISAGDFAISNYDGKTQFSFRVPSQEHVEYLR